MDIPAKHKKDKDKDKVGMDIVKKHPPKRLQRLADTLHAVLTSKEIEEKQKKVEERRLEIIEERINKAKSAQHAKGEKVYQSGTQVQL